MAYFKTTTFSGTAPAISPRLLGDQFGQIASNVNLESGRMVGIYDDSTVFALSNNLRKSVYRYEDKWLQWSEEGISVVPGPIPGDTDKRLYFTGQDYPRIGTYNTLVSGSVYPNTSYRLGVPAPSDAPTAVTEGDPDDTLTPSDVSYVFTLVTAMGEEGPPSAPSAIIQKDETQRVKLTFDNSALPSGNYNFGTGAAKRIYRSNTGSSISNFQFVDQVAYNASEYLDYLDNDELGEVIPSATWIGPPDDDDSLYPDGPLQGLIPLAQGTMAGFTGKRFCLSEPFLPHAWPINYRITTETDIIAIASTANGVVALTDGQPYFITGTEPSAMTATRVDLTQACINEKSVVDMGDYVLYASPDGLCAVEGASGSVVTEGLITRQQWNDDFSPDTYQAFKREGTYVAYTSDGSGWIFDPKGGENSLQTFTGSAIRGGFRDPKNGELYVIRSSSLQKVQAGSTKVAGRFKSKKFVTPKPVSMGWVSVSANEFPVAISVWGDGVLIANFHLTKSADGYSLVTNIPANISSGTLHEPIMRLPPVIAQEWEVEVSGFDINEFCLAQSMDEIRQS